MNTPKSKSTRRIGVITIPVKREHYCKSKEKSEPDINVMGRSGIPTRERLSYDDSVSTSTALGQPVLTWYNMVMHK